MMTRLWSGLLYMLVVAVLVVLAAAAVR